MADITKTKDTGKKVSSTPKKQSDAAPKQDKPFDKKLLDAINKRDVTTILNLVRSASSSELQKLRNNPNLTSALQQYSKLAQKSSSKNVFKKAWDKVCEKAPEVGAWVATEVLGTSGTNWLYDNVLGGINTVPLVSSSKIAEHAKTNKELLAAENSPLAKAIKKTGYIENQNSGGWDAIKYGRYDLSHSGCGVFATYNAMKALGETPDLVDIMTYYERNGLAVDGACGTSSAAIKKYLTSKGHNVEQAGDMSPANLNRMGKQHPAFIALSLNDRTTLMGAGHYVGISREGKDPNYLFQLHNCGNSKKYSSLSEAVANVADNPFTFCLLGIDKKVQK